jgi:excisionase family DNA binding protein
MVMSISAKDMYRAVFKEYPDVLDVKQVSRLLNVSTKTVYRLLRSGELDSLKIGRAFRIPKVNVMKYVKMLHPLLSEQIIA